MPRLNVVTGSASGIGKATAELLRSRGEIVIGVDLRDADIIADLGAPEGRAEMLDAVASRAGGPIDGLLVCAGLSNSTPAVMAVNYFGALATLQGLQPLLAAGDRPRAVAVTSYAVTLPLDDALMAAGASGDEAAAIALSEGKGEMIYTSSKALLAQHCRQMAVTQEWAGAGILLNMVAPGIVDTPMMTHHLRDPAALSALLDRLPLPVGRVAGPDEIAPLLAFLASPANTYITGQQIFIDGGTEAAVAVLPK